MARASAPCPALTCSGQTHGQASSQQGKGHWAIVTGLEPVSLRACPLQTTPVYFIIKQFLTPHVASFWGARAKGHVAAWQTRAWPWAGRAGCWAERGSLPLEGSH